MNAHDIAQYAMQKLQETGAQQYACQAHTSAKREFNVDGGKFSLLRTTIDNQLDLTLIKDQKRGKILINAFNQEAVDEAVRDCLAAAEGSAADPAWELVPGAQRKFILGAPDGDMDQLFARTQEMLAAIGREYPKVMVEQMIVAHQRSEGIYLNNLGASYETVEGLYEAQVMFSGHEGEKSSSFNFAAVVTDQLDKPFLDQGSMRQNLADAEKQIDTVATEGKFVGAVVFTPDCAGDVLGELLGNFVGDGVILDGTSPWKDRLGEQVADQRLTLSAAPHHPAIVCGERYVADGYLSEDYDIIKNGRLNQFMLSGYVANKTGKKRAPNSSFSLVMQPGDQPLEEIIAGIDRGLLVSRFSGGSPASNGDFSGVAKNSFLIEKGKITSAVSETMISGNLAEMVNHLRGISREFVRNGYSRLPWFAVDGITISGK